MPDNEQWDMHTLITNYNKGFKGSIYDPVHYAKFMSELPMPYFGEAAPHLAGSGKGKISTPFRSVLHFDRNAYEERQVTGDCVSHCVRNSCDVTRCVQIHIGGTAEGWVARGATEAIYGSRGHSGQGMSCSGAADFVHRKGGIILRQKFASADLTKYTGMTGAGWGGRGVPSDIIEVGQKHQIKTVSQIRSLEEARDALANGYGIGVCSNQGFSSVRDSKGFARPQGSWSHGMAWTACDDTGSEIAFMIQNSWAAWNSGGQPDWGPIPPGAFLIHADVAHRMISAGGAFAFSNCEGYPAQKLPDYGTSSFL